MQPSELCKYGAAERHAGIVRDGTRARAAGRSDGHPGGDHDCSNDYEAVTSLAERFEDDDDAYVELRSTDYALYIRERNHVRAGAAAPPEEEPSCGVF